MYMYIMLNIYLTYSTYHLSFFLSVLNVCPYPLFTVRLPNDNVPRLQQVQNQLSIALGRIYIVWSCVNLGIHSIIASKCI